MPWTLEVISSAISYKNPSKSDKWAEFLMDLATSLAVSFKSIKMGTKYLSIKTTSRAS